MESKVDTRHPEYSASLETWARCRLASSGQRAVHNAGTILLPNLSGQTTQEYQAYLGRTLYYNATGRTVDGLSGLVFRKPPVTQVPSALSFLSEDVDSSGTPLIGFCEKLVEELLIVGRVGVLTDFPVTVSNGTLADLRAANAQPYLVFYAAEQIINWRVETANNQRRLSMVVLAEFHTEAVGFEEISVQQRRVLRLTSGVYTTETWRKLPNDKGQDEWRLVEGPMVPMLNGAPLDYIPFVIGGPRGVDSAVAKPPIEDLVDVNLSHYRTTADYEHGLHFTGLPTPVVTGHSFKDDEIFELGSTKVKAFPNPEAKPMFLEFTGTGLEALSKRLAEKEAMMVALGARLLAPERKAVEAAETASIHRAGENGVLASLAGSASSVVSVAMTWAAAWVGSTEASTIKLNTDYMPAGLTSQELSELIKAWQGGAISYETLYDNMQRGEVARTGVTAEEERDAIAAQSPEGLTNGNGE